MDISAGELSAALQRITEGEKGRHQRASEFIEMTAATGIYAALPRLISPDGRGVGGQRQAE